MAGPLIADHVWDTTTTTGAGTLTLSGTAKLGYQSFNAGIGDGNSCTYSIVDSANGAWEVGIGTYTNSGVTLSRTTVLKSSNANALVSFAAGTKDVIVVEPAANVNARQPVASVYNLKVKNNATTPNTKVDISIGPFDSVYEAILEDSFGNSYRARNAGTLTIDTGTVGANGIDTGSQVLSTWYYIYLIWNPGTATLAGLISTSASAPTLPSGYTYKALIGAVRSDASVHFIAFTQFDRQVYTALQSVFTNQGVTTPGTYQSISISTLVPPIAKAATGMIGGTLSASGWGIVVAGDVNGQGSQFTQSGTSGGTTTVFSKYFAGCGFTNVPMLTAQTLYWTSFAAGNFSGMDITGWTY